MLTIWGRANSVNVQKVLWCAEELGLRYDRVDVGGAFGGNREASYLARNPNGRVPLLTEGDYAIWESNSIVRYLAARFGDPGPRGAGGLWTADAAERGLADQWMDWQQTTLAPPMTTIFWGHIRTPPEKRDLAAIGKAEGEAAAAWAIVEGHLARHEYLSGSRFGMGDIPVGAMAWRWFRLPVERPAMPSLARWFDALQRRPGYRKWIMVELT